MRPSDYEITNYKEKAIIKSAKKEEEHAIEKVHTIAHKHLHKHKHKHREDIIKLDEEKINQLRNERVEREKKERERIQKLLDNKKNN